MLIASTPERRIPMLERLAQMLGVSTGVAGILVALIVLQLATQAYALVDLARYAASK